MAKLMVALVIVALLGLIFTPDVGAIIFSGKYRKRRDDRSKKTSRIYEDAKNNDNTAHVKYKARSLQGWKWQPRLNKLGMS